VELSRFTPSITWPGAEATAGMWDFCNAWQIFSGPQPAARDMCFHVAKLQRGVRMSIEILIVILILTLTAGFALNWWDAKRNS
jgi:hypothetical protein